MNSEALEGGVTTDVSENRRRFLAVATSAVAAAGVAAVAVAFIGSWNPSVKAKAAGAPVKADISKLEPGQMVVIEWRGKPVYVVRRTQAMLDDLPNVDYLLKDPDSAIAKQPGYTTDNTRALRPKSTWLWKVCARTWAVRQSSGRKSGPLISAASAGMGVSSAPATAPNLTWPDGCFPGCRRRLT